MLKFKNPRTLMFNFMNFNSKNFLSYFLSLSLILIGFPDFSMAQTVVDQTIQNTPCQGATYSFKNAEGATKRCSTNSKYAEAQCDGDTATAQDSLQTSDSDTIENSDLTKKASGLAGSAVMTKEALCNKAEAVAKTTCAQAKTAINTDKSGCLSTIKCNSAQCEEIAEKLLAEVEENEESSLGAKIALGAAAAAALAGLGKLAMDAMKTKKGTSDSKKQEEAPAKTEEKKAVASSDPLCAKNDYTCLCGANRTQKPIECSSDCPFLSSGWPDTSCLKRKFGENYATKALDKNNNIVASTVNREAQIDEYVAAAATSSSVVNTATNKNAMDMGTPQNYNSKGRAAATSTSNPNAIYDELSEIKGGLKPSAEVKKALSDNRNGTSDTAQNKAGNDSSTASSTSEGSDSRPGHFTRASYDDIAKNPKSIYAKVIQQNLEKERNPANNPQSQIAESNTNLFHNLSSAYQRYQPFMLP